MTAYGVRDDFFQPPPGEVRGNDAAWSEGMRKLDKLSQAYKIRNQLFSKCSRYAFPKHKLITSTNPHGANQCKPRDYSYARRLAYLPGHNSAASGAMAAGYEMISGLHACRTAHMVIVDDLGRLHSEEADLEWVLHLLYIVARGVPVTSLR